MIPPSAPSSASTSGVSLPVQGASYAVVVLTLMNLFNYLDRYVPSAVKEGFKKDLDLDDAQTAFPLTAFVFVYMFASPIFGAIADRGSRKLLIAAGVALWSLATAAGAYAETYTQFLIARALVGIGEAAYATISPSLIADYFPPDKRNRIMTFFYIAVPVGSALGFTLGGAIGGMPGWGWRWAFLLCGLPGLALAMLALGIRDPGRGTFDVVKVAPGSWGDALRAMWRSKEYVNSVAGYTAVTFAAGGMADWFPTFLTRTHDMTMGEAGFRVGAVTALGGLIGTALGGWSADKMRGRTRQPYLALSGLSMIPATLFAVLALVVADRNACVACIFFAQLFLWFYNGPVNAIIANSVHSTIVARAFAISILTIHLLGDAISPPIIGKISDLTGSLAKVVTIVPVFMGIGALIWLWGWRTIPEPAPAVPSPAASPGSPGSPVPVDAPPGAPPPAEPSP